MKKQVHSIVIILMLLCIFSCTESYDFEFLDTDDTIVIEGWITNNPGPHKVRVTKTFTYPGLNAEDFMMTRKARGEMVDNALIIISDDEGTIDTLTRTNGNFVYDDTTFFGYYSTNKITGKPGHTYYLSVQTEGQEYLAEAYMPFVPEIDALEFEYYYNEIKHDEYYAPLISFKQSVSTKDFFYFTLNSPITLNFDSEVSPWAASILNDEFLDEYVVRLNVGEGTTVDYWRKPQIWMFPGTPITIYMHSITEGAYNFINGLMKQVQSDGGVFKPSQFTPEGNISNGALGFFGAASVTVISGTVPL